MTTITERLHQYLVKILVHQKFGQHALADDYRQLARIAINRLRLRGLMRCDTYRNYQLLIDRPTYRDIKRAVAGRSFPTKRVVVSV